MFLTPPGVAENGAIDSDDLRSFFGSQPGVRLLRLDAIHPEISGNKWFKLRYYLQEASASGKQILTLGGPWSNHLLATSSACSQAGIPCTGIVSGERPAEPSFILRRSEELGMRLVFISRSHHRLLMQTFSHPSSPDGESPESDAINQVPDKVKRLLSDPGSLLVPAGGYGPAGAAGASTILQHTGTDHTHLVAAVGTGTMLAGLINGSAAGTQVTGIPVLKNEGLLRSAIRALVSNGEVSWSLEDDAHFGGYARYDAALLDFMNRFYQRTRIPLDFVYTGKMMYALDRMIREGRFKPGARILAIHSGGLPGNLGLPKGSLIW